MKRRSMRLIASALAFIVMFMSFVSDTSLLTATASDGTEGVTEETLAEIASETGAETESETAAEAGSVVENAEVLTNSAAAETVIEESMIEGSSTDETVIEEPAGDEAAMEEPAGDEADMGEPVEDEAVMEEYGNDKTAMGDAAEDEATSEEPDAELPVEDAVSEDVPAADGEGMPEDGTADLSEEDSELEEEELVTTIEIRYEALEGGTVSVSSETVDLTLDPVIVVGSTATANDGYVFTGWICGEEPVSDTLYYVPEEMVDTVYTATFEKVNNNTSTLDTYIDGVHIVATAKEAVFSKAAELRVNKTAVAQETLDAIEAALAGDVVEAQKYAYDISIYDPAYDSEDHKYQPDDSIQINFYGIQMDENAEQSATVVYVPENNAAAVEPQSTSSSAYANMAAFAAEHFSKYIVVITSLSTGAIVFDQSVIDTLETGNEYNVFDMLIAGNYNESKYSNIEITGLAVPSSTKYDQKY